MRVSITDHDGYCDYSVNGTRDPGFEVVLSRPAARRRKVPKSRSAAALDQPAKTLGLRLKAAVPASQEVMYAAWRHWVAFANSSQWPAYWSLWVAT